METTGYLQDAWFIEVYGRVMAAFRTRDAASAALAVWQSHEHPYLTHGPASLNPDGSIKLPGGR